MHEHLEKNAPASKLRLAIILSSSIFLVEEITKLLETKFSISHATIQTNCLSCQKKIISQDLTHR